MKKTLFIMIAICTGCISPSIAQDINPSLIGKKFWEVKNMEMKLKGKVYTSDDDIIVPGGMAAPVVYIRPKRSHENFYVEYTFTKKDSVVTRIEYKWGDDNDKKFLMSKYDSFLQDFNKRHGTSKAVGEYQHYWNTKEQLEVSLYGNFGDVPMVSIHLRKKDN